MLKQVMMDLMFFIVFYTIINVVFAIMLAIIDLGNLDLNADKNVRDLKNLSSYPGNEYKHMNPFLAHFFTVMRISVGDFSFDSAS